MHSRDSNPTLLLSPNNNNSKSPGSRELMRVMDRMDQVPRDVFMITSDGLHNLIINNFIPPSLRLRRRAC